LEVLDRLDAETGPLRLEVDADVRHVFEVLSPAEYQRFLALTLGFVEPVERALGRVPGLARVVDVRRLRKHELLWRDLESLGLKSSTIAALPRCGTLPALDSVHQALGWAYVIEHSTLAHSELFLRLAGDLPGIAAFASSYLKCYFGAVGEAWRSFGTALEAAVETPAQANELVGAAVALCREHWSWQHRLEDAEAVAPWPIAVRR
jgi:heme oxygenase